MERYSFLLVFIGLVVIVSSLFSAGLGLVHINNHNHTEHQLQTVMYDDAVEKTDHQTYVTYKDEVMKKHMAEGDYACCLAAPCASCLEMDPYHGEGAACHCLEDIVNGEGPCDECAGGILSGRGNPYLVSYFADALTDKLGETHRSTIEQIIDERYEG